MEYINISMPKDFSITPGPRNRSEGDFSGQQFFEEILDPTFAEALKDNKGVTIDLDGTLGYGTSFLEEVFGGLARKYTPEKVFKNLIIISNEEEYLKNDIDNYIKDANQ